MKPLRVLLALFPLTLAASSLLHPQAFGLLKFGMSAKEADAAYRHIHSPNGSRDPGHMTAAEARPLFVTNTSGRMAHNVEFDRACPVFVHFKAEPILSEVTIAGPVKPMADYAYVQKTWEDFQDLGDCKFQRKGTKGTFPTADQFGEESKDIVTDTWELAGVRVELSVHYLNGSTLVGGAQLLPRCCALLTAREIAPPQ